MVLRLGRSLNVERNISVGYGVVFYIKPFSYSDFKEVEASAQRIARNTASEAEQIEVESVDDEDLSPETEDSVKARYSQALLMGLLLRFGAGWDGVVLAPEDVDEAPLTASVPESPAPFVKSRIEEFLKLFPGVALTLQHELLAPYQAVALEGKGSAPLLNTDTPVG